MYGPGFNRPGKDECRPKDGYDESFVYRVDTTTLTIDRVVPVGSVPKFLATTPDSRWVLVSNWCSYDLSVIDTESARQVKRIVVGRYPRGIAVDAAHDIAYVAVMGSFDIARVDLQSMTLAGWLRGVGQSPRHLVLGPNNRYLYASLNGDGRLTKIDLETGRPIAYARTGSKPRSMVLSPDGEHLYVVNYLSDTISKVRALDMQTLQTLPAADKPIGITYDPLAREVWVSAYSGVIQIFAD